MLSILSRSFLRGNSNGSLAILPYSTRSPIQAERNSTDKNKITILKYFINKYVGIIEYLENRLEKKFPTTIKVYRTYRIGSSEFMSDMKRCVLLIKKMGIKNGILDLTIEEQQFVHSMIKDMIKLLPTLSLLALPFTQYIILPLGYKYPRQMLSQHFWTEEQKVEFALYHQKLRLKHNKPLFRCMQAEVDNLADGALKEHWKNIIACLGSGMHPSTTDIITCSILFEYPPYSLDSLKKRYVKELLAIHGMSVWMPLKICRLQERACTLLQMDSAIEKEGGVEKLPVEVLQWVGTRKQYYTVG